MPTAGVGGDRPDHRLWRTVLSPAWNIETTPNGGYAVSSVVRAMAASVEGHDDPISLTTHYLRPTEGGREATIEVEVVRSGRRTTTLRAVMQQSGSPRLACLATFSDLVHWSGDEQWTIPAPRLPSPAACVDRSRLPQGVELPILSRLDIRLDPDSVRSGGSGRAEMAGWIRFGDGRPPSVDGLPLMADAFPPSVFARLGQVGWVPTIELTVHVRSRPTPGWIQARFWTGELHRGMLIEDGMLWDSAGTLVAQSRQLALLLPPA